MTALLAFFGGSVGGAGGTLSAASSGDAEAEGFMPPNNQLLTTNTVTVTPTGGSGVYTHSWSFVSGANIFTISNASAATVSWTGNMTRFYRSAVWRDTVSDGVSTIDVDVNVSGGLS